LVAAFDCPQFEDDFSLAVTPLQETFMGFGGVDWRW
jgi:hypothetical protein